MRPSIQFLSRYSLRIATISGIPIRLHYTMLLFPILLFPTLTTTNDVSLYLFILLAIPVSVLLHELGHCFSARRYGIPTRDIYLTPIGGVAMIEGMPARPLQEAVIAIAGPLVSLALALIFGLLGWLFHGLPVDNLPLLWLGCLMNAMLLIFNLIPAFPMDGGRVLRALLAPRIGFLKATRIASGIGQGLCILFIFYGATRTRPSPFSAFDTWDPNPILIFIGIMIFLAARREYEMVKRVVEQMQKEASELHQPLPVNEESGINSSHRK